MNAREERSGEGWLVFAAFMLWIGGIGKILDALWTFKYDERPVDTILFDDNVEAWGIVWLIVGIVLVAAGVAVLRRAPWARLVGTIAAAVAAITSLVWIYAYPVGSLLNVVLAVLVVYALTTYGDEAPF